MRSSWRHQYWLNFIRPPAIAPILISWIMNGRLPPRSFTLRRIIYFSAMPVTSASKSRMASRCSGRGGMVGCLQDLRASLLTCPQIIHRVTDTSSSPPIGAAPGQYTVTSSYVFGVGAYLLAGSEVYQLADKTH